MHGVLAPRSSWRKDVVPKPREARPFTDREEKKLCKRKPHRDDTKGARAHGGATDGRTDATGQEASRTPASFATPVLPVTPKPTHDAPGNSTGARPQSKHSLGVHAPTLRKPSTNDVGDVVASGTGL
jgi:hypothetical protein